MTQKAAKETHYEFEELIGQYLSEAKERLEIEFVGTREAIKQIAEEKIVEYFKFTGKPATNKEKELLQAVFTVSMYQAFCFGYGIGRVEGSTCKKVYL